jgi:hypothetical protein
MYDNIKYIWSLEDLRERLAAMAVKAEKEIESEVSSSCMTEKEIESEVSSLCMTSSSKSGAWRTLGRDSPPWQSRRRER